LTNWHRNEFAQILFFVGSRLQETDPDLYASFFAYLSDNSIRSDHFHMVLVWEAGAWTETVLENLPDPSDLLDPLTVRLVLISGLAALATRAYEGMAGLVTE